MGKVYILILNWNSWQDTIECVESVLKSDYRDFQIIIIDNDSKDSSVEFIKKYLNREIFPRIPENTYLKRNILPFIKDKIPYILYTEEEALKGGNLQKEKNIFCPQNIKYPVIIIKNRKNYGFAKGNNIALKFVLKRKDFSYVWLLNNDTIIEKNTLENLLKKAKENKKIGFVGSVIRYYQNPNFIQAVGGGKFIQF